MVASCLPNWLAEVVKNLRTKTDVIWNVDFCKLGIPKVAHAQEVKSLWIFENVEKCRACTKPVQRNPPGHTTEIRTRWRPPPLSVRCRRQGRRLPALPGSREAGSRRQGLCRSSGLGKPPITEEGSCARPARVPRGEDNRMAGTEPPERRAGDSGRLHHEMHRRCGTWAPQTETDAGGWWVPAHAGQASVSFVLRNQNPAAGVWHHLARGERRAHPAIPAGGVRSAAPERRIASGPTEVQPSLDLDMAEPWRHGSARSNQSPSQRRHARIHELQIGVRVRVWRSRTWREPHNLLGVWNRLLGVRGQQRLEENSCRKMIYFVVVVVVGRIWVFWYLRRNLYVGSVEIMMCEIIHV